MPHHRRGIERLLEGNGKREIDEKEKEVEGLLVFLSQLLSVSQENKPVVFQIFPNSKVKILFS